MRRRGSRTSAPVLLAGFERAPGLHQRFLEGAADGHDFADGLHLRAEGVVGAGEFLELPLGDFDDDVVDGGLEAGRRFAGDVVGDLVEGVADGELGGDFGDGKAGGLGGQRGGARDARVHLDDDHAAVGGVDGELDVGAAGFDADFAHDGDGGVAHLLVFAVGEGLRGGDGDGVAGVHAHGVEVFDGADDDDVVGEVAHDLELVFLPAEDAFFDEALVDGREIEAAGEDFHQLFAVVGDAAAGAAEGEAGADEDGEAELAGEVEAVAQVVDQRGARHVEADADHGVFEEEAVFGLLDGFELGADELDVVAVEDAGVGEIDGEVEGGLAADGGQEGELAGGGIGGEHFGFDADDLLDVLAGERLDVGAVGQLGVGHDGGGVGVDEDDLVALLLEGLAGLGAGVVELGGLADDDGAGADDEDLLNVISAWHWFLN